MLSINKDVVANPKTDRSKKPNQRKKLKPKCTNQTETEKAWAVFRLGHFETELNKTELYTQCKKNIVCI